MASSVVMSGAYPLSGQWSTPSSRKRSGDDMTVDRGAYKPKRPQDGLAAKAQRERLDKMNERDFMAAVMRMGKEERESLMKSELDRLRTYLHLWPIPSPVDVRDLAKDGFYYTGTSDRVTCAFCGGSLGNWEKEDVVRESHRKYFSFCKMAQRKECGNIPLTDRQPTRTLGDSVSARKDARPVSPGNHFPVQANRDYAYFGIDQTRASHGDYRFVAARQRSFGDRALRVDSTQLSEAGFYYEGPGDKVRCFWCDGALEEWAEGDDPWKEHAKWYPGCGFVQGLESRQFVKTCRTEMSEEDFQAAANLAYNNNRIMEQPFVENLCPDDSQGDTTLDQLINTSASELTDEEAESVIVTMTCRSCSKAMVDTVILPCGHLVLCSACFQPSHCPGCGLDVEGTCTIYMG